MLLSADLTSCNKKKKYAKLRTRIVDCTDCYGCGSFSQRFRAMNQDIQTRVLNCVPDLYEPRPLTDLPTYLPRFLSKMISADLVAYNEVDLMEPRIVATGDEPVFLDPNFLRAFEAHIHEHPIIRHQRETGDVSARKISDFLSRAEYHRLGIYKEVYGPIGAEDQFALTLHISQRRVVALAMNRSRRSFTEQDRTLLNLLRPHLVQVYRNASGFSFLRGQLDTVLSAVQSLTIGIVVLGTRGVIEFASIRARSLLNEYFPDSGRGSELPAPLKQWLAASNQWRDKPTPAATTDFALARGEKCLKVRRSAGSNGECVLLLDESGSEPSPSALQSLGLTARQAEVLFWLAQGKSNPEIAKILGTAARTIQKHVEHIFGKLHVETRTAAARRALEFLSTNRPTH